MKRVAWGLMLVALGLLASRSASAQAVGSVTGVVTDQQSGQPLAGVQVFLEGTGRGVLTQENGRYFLINVPVGTYTLVAELIGYATVQHQNVVVATDIARVINVQMVTQAVAVAEVVVEAERVPLVELRASGSSNTLTSEDIEALPVTSIQGALAFQQGFLEVPDNTDVLSYGESRRNVLSPIRIRGGRGAETLTLIDGIPVQNWVLGGPTLDPNLPSVAQLDYVKGGFEPQYGNALSGIINIALREGGDELEGSLEYQTSRFGGWLGNTQDELLGLDLYQGFLSGPIPGTGGKGRFMVSGRHQNAKDRVLEFDDDVYDPNNPRAGFNTPFLTDIFPGWRGVGYDARYDVVGKLTYYFTPAIKLNVSGIRYERERQPFDFLFLYTYDDPLSAPNLRTAADSAYYGGNLSQYRLAPTDFPNVIQGTSRLERTLLVANWDHTLQRSSYRISVGRFDQQRLTCNWFQGVCLGGGDEGFQDPNFTDDRFHGPAPVGQRGLHPTMGTDFLYGGEDITTWVGRGDWQWQASDHHNFQAGVYWQQHDLGYDESECTCGNIRIVVNQKYSIDPWDAAFYVQDRIEYDFLTARIGFRFDYGKAPGVFLRDPIDPTAGSTAADVCKDPNGMSSHLDKSWVELGADPAWARLGEGCGGNADITRRAALVAFEDDFVGTRTRTQFSPRIGISFPVTETSSVFFNYGVYSQNPVIKNLYNFTGVGTPHEGCPLGFALGFAGENGLKKCGLSEPVTMAQYRGPYTHETRPEGVDKILGNTNLQIERTSSYEVGLLTQISDIYALGITLFAKDQTGLTGFRDGGVLPDGTGVFDIGQTYGTARPRYTALVNSDYQTVRGIELQLRRGILDFWGFDINYSFSQARTNGAALDRALEDDISREQALFTNAEFPSEIDIPHVFNAVLRFVAREETPDVPFGEWLKNTTATLTARAAGGVPYTPTTTLTGGGSTINTTARLDANSKRGPSTFEMDFQLTKDWSVTNMNYGFFLRAENLLDAKNCIQVFTSTGRCEAGQADQARRATGNPLTDPSSISSSYLDRPQYFAQRRTIVAGLRVSF
ncbi:MAG: TonB-dependent receptor [Gemmatimonadetes bacterium]|nr:TonB-dependent receptor [Gemmatimonadota bacterium]